MPRSSVAIPLFLLRNLLKVGHDQGSDRELQRVHDHDRRAVRREVRIPLEHGVDQREPEGEGLVRAAERRRHRRPRGGIGGAGSEDGEEGEQGPDVQRRQHREEGDAVAQLQSQSPREGIAERVPYYAEEDHLRAENNGIRGVIALRLRRM